MREVIEQILHFQCGSAYALPLNIEALCRTQGIGLRPRSQIVRVVSVWLYSMAPVGQTLAQLRQPTQNAEGLSYGVETFLSTPRFTVLMAPVPKLSHACTHKPHELCHDLC